MTTIKLFCSQRICWIFSVFFFFFSFSVSLLLLGFFFFKVNLYSLPAGVNGGTADRLSACLSASCQVFFPWTRSQKQKKIHAIVVSLSLSLFLSFSTEAVVCYLTAPLVFFLRYFSLNQSSGELTARQNIPAGSYWLRVGVSDGVWPDVISGVRVHVRDLVEKAILSSASLRLTGKVGGNTDSPVGLNTVLIWNHRPPAAVQVDAAIQLWLYL